ncbi:Uncharacterised protein [Salmonella enterica subsp. enterica serovar Bovismorbificans]|uniref:Uncharacterized protein n=1 Tax=Salmonella enterica subsp. enterica serovar Bovismorbificans TaxID=58097 RepID=A0A655BYF9_SALET|nr:Uncharacterised protein [Salmonella enterica subsp. enterica serovar Bovismorbificans]
MFPPTLANVGAGNGVPALLGFNLNGGEQQIALLIEINRVVMRAVRF